MQGADTPEQLMRSRYTAFVFKNVGYLLQTTHEDMMSADLRQELELACEGNEWLSLRVIDAPHPKADNGVVQFVAYCRQGQSVGELHERSYFKKVDGAWLYQSGQVLPHYKIGVNEACWCGSGKKIKKCHLV